MTDTKPTIDEHSCSYFCDRPECIKAQRDSMREELKRIHSAEMPVEPKVYQQQFFCDDGTIESHEAVLKHDYDALKAYAQRKDAEAEALRKDAKMYRWLRENVRPEYVSKARGEFDDRRMKWQIQPTLISLTCINSDVTFDEAIDNAMKGGE